MRTGRLLRGCFFLHSAIREIPLVANRCVGLLANVGPEHYCEAPTERRATAYRSGRGGSYRDCYTSDYRTVLNLSLQYLPILHRDSEDTASNLIISGEFEHGTGHILNSRADRCSRQWRSSVPMNGCAAPTRRRSLHGEA